MASFAKTQLGRKSLSSCAEGTSSVWVGSRQHTVHLEANASKSLTCSHGDSDQRRAASKSILGSLEELRLLVWELPLLSDTRGHHTCGARAPQVKAIEIRNRSAAENPKKTYVRSSRTRLNHGHHMGGSFSNSALPSQEEENAEREQTFAQGS